MKKILFGIAIAIAALSANALTISNDEDGELVGKESTNHWLIIDSLDEGTMWECLPGGTSCKGNLKAGATPDANGYYSDSEVTPSQDNSTFELIDEEQPPLKMTVQLLFNSRL